jgi:phosphoribosyl-ATP pyrophosphohydrolase/phosphoribosyl-AMP cyclohydrolase
MPKLDELHWNEAGLLPAIVQDQATRQVLMLGWMNAEALALTLKTGNVHFWSRSRQELWRKGATSGNVMLLAELAYDCDGDALLVQVWPEGPACHTGNVSCFYRQLTFEDLLAPGAGARGFTAGEATLTWPAEAAEGADTPPAG